MDFNIDRINEALGDICPQCGAVLRMTKKVVKTSGGKKRDVEMFVCDYCGYREEM